MSEHKPQFTPQELVVILRASIKMGTLMRQHREFLVNVLGNYMGGTGACAAGAAAEHAVRGNEQAMRTGHVAPGT